MKVASEDLVGPVVKGFQITRRDQIEGREAIDKPLDSKANHCKVWAKVVEH